MDTFQKTIQVFPLDLRRYFDTVPSDFYNTIQEIRLYRAQPIVLSVRGTRFFLSIHGGITDQFAQGVLCQSEWLAQTLDRACDYSVYAHQHELRNGYVSGKGGIRIGVAGTAVMEKERIVSFRDVTSLCIRVGRQHFGCADLIIRQITENGLHSALICGEPSSGKTALLKDVIIGCSRKGIAISVIDERGELSPDLNVGCDVLRDCPKPLGIELAIRALAPQLLILDELGEEDIQGVLEGCRRAVPTVATVHCGCLNELRSRPLLWNAIRHGAFSKLFFLKGRTDPGKIAQCVKTEEWLDEIDRRSTSAYDGNHCGSDGALSYAKTGENLAFCYGRYSQTIRADSVYQCANHRTDAGRPRLYLVSNDGKSP